MWTQGFQPIKPVSKKDQVVETIKQAILSGSLTPGAAMVENRLAQELGVGTPLVREALIELEHQGFVQRFPYKGTMVTRLSPADIEQIFSLRVELESLAVEWAKRYASAEDIAALRRLVEQMREAATRLDLSLFYEKDLAFHRSLWQLSGNVYLVSALERIVIPLFAFFLMRNDRDHVTYHQSTEQHEEFIEALVTLEASALRDLVRRSMTTWKEEMLTRLFPAPANPAAARPVDPAAQQKAVS